MCCSPHQLSPVTSDEPSAMAGARGRGWSLLISQSEHNTLTHRHTETDRDVTPAAETEWTGERREETLEIELKCVHQWPQFTIQLRCVRAVTK